MFFLALLPCSPRMQFFVHLRISSPSAVLEEEKRLGKGEGEEWLKYPCGTQTPLVFFTGATHKKFFFPPIIF